MDISIHAPREGGDSVGSGSGFTYGIPFQSTPPARGATGNSAAQIHFVTISIHAPREGGDHGSPMVLVGMSYFNPRPPRGGRRFFLTIYFFLLFISIHAPREGGDFARIGSYMAQGLGISIHAPREGGD